MRAARPFVLSIGGFDPSAGAGVLSDIKTYEHFGLNGLAVTTCITGQSHEKVHDVHWLNKEQILVQLKPLLSRYEIKVCKIAVIQSWAILNEIIDFLLMNEPNMMIVLDPVYESSSGYSFCSAPNAELRDEVLSKVQLITPNQLETDMLGFDKTILKCNVLLKSVRGKAPGTDHLILKEGETISFEANNLGSEKHGSGCVLSSSIAAQLALGESLLVAVGIAKENIENYLGSSTNLIGTLNT
ncbi:MAG: hydroxymethylpyrimidine/phosphomethylpyrimidine kinase [Flavobacteriales bacterium]|nr:hydroxymethylpyrimidine/phosphomethylpyrimidine kinase [Flavobacteriales bacterium]